MNAQNSNLGTGIGNCAAGACQQPAPLLTGQGVTGIGNITQGVAPMQNYMGSAPSSISMPITDLNQPQAMTTESIQYLNGFLRTQIGNRVKVEFLVGTNTYLEKSGKLLAVGANYIILEEAMSDDLLVCDFFNIKFITIYR